MVDTEQRHLLLTQHLSEPRACARQGRCPMRLRALLPGELTDLQRNSQPKVQTLGGDARAR